MFGYTTGGIEQIVTLGGLWSLHNPRTFGIAVLVFHIFLTFLHIRRAETFDGLFYCLNLAGEGYHVGVQLGIIDNGVTPEEPCLIIVVDKHCGVDMIPLAVLIERLSDGIAERTGRRVSYGHTYCHTSGDLRVGTDVPIEFAVSLNGLGSPGTIVGPGETLEVQR